MKTIDNFLTKDKESQQEANKSRSEAMTLEEMAVNVQERKILGHERKIDMNIIMFVSLCLCGLIIINVVLYFLIGESKSNTLQPIPATQDTRNLLKERREERVALLSESDLVDTNLPINDTEIAGEGAEINVAVNDIANGDDSSPGSLQNNLSAIETTTADESQVVQDNSPEVVKSTVQELQDQPLQKQEVKDTEANEIKVSDIETDVSDVIEQQAAELKSEPEQTEEVPFDVVRQHHPRLDRCLVSTRRRYISFLLFRHFRFRSWHEYCGMASSSSDKADEAGMDCYWCGKP